MNKAVFTGWSCPAGPAELVDYLVDNAEELLYEDFAKVVDLSTAPLEKTQFEILAIDWCVTWFRTRLPSGQDAWVMQHSGIEYLFTESGRFNRERESRLAVNQAD